MSKSKFLRKVLGAAAAAAVSISLLLPGTLVSAASESAGYSDTSGASDTSGYSDTSGASDTSGYSDTSGASDTSNYSDTSGASDTSGYSDTSGASDTSGYSDTSGAADTSDSNKSESGYIDTGKNGTLTIYYYYAGFGVMEGVSAHVYRIASFDGGANFNVLSPFSELGLDLKDMKSIETAEQWKAIIDPLTIFINENNVAPYASAVSDAEGYAKMGQVETGLYLGISDPIEIDGVRYVYYSLLAPVPGPVMLDEHGNNTWDGTWQNASYDVIAVPKRETTKLDGTPEQYTVYKQWADAGYADQRPSFITVKIYCDGNIFENVTLNSENNWQYSWKYEKGHNFTIEEELNSEDYTATVSQNETSFVIINTKNPEKPENPDNPDNPNNPDNPTKKVKKNKKDTPSVPDSSDDGSSHDGDTLDGNKKDEGNDGGDGASVLGAVRKLIEDLPAVLGARRLPQTGQLWWPIPVLAILGMLLIIAGIRSERRRKKENE